MKTEIYDITGMQCAACSAAVERTTQRIDGVKSSSVNLITGTMTITFDEKKVTRSMIEQRVKKAGFGIKISSDNPGKYAQDEKSAFSKATLTATIIFSILLLYISMGQMLKYKLPLPNFLNMHMYPKNFALAQLILTVPILYLGRSFFRKGFSSLFQKSPTMDSLVAIGSSFSFLYSLFTTYKIFSGSSDKTLVHNLYYESAALVITFVMIGKYIESQNKLHTKDAIKKIISLSPNNANLVLGDEIKTVKTSELQKGDIVLVKPGERIPLDGVVTQGFGEVDESLITGESLPVKKVVGSTVTGGSINSDGVIYVKITHIGSETVLSKIIKCVENAQNQKAPVARVADKVAGIFVPCVIAAALIAGIIWLIIGKDFAFVLKIFTSVLVIACPCALGLATPTAIMVGTGLAAKNKILIRSGKTLEQASKTTVAVFDKTGTVTYGKPRISGISVNNTTEALLLSYAASAESLSSHPLAKAIVDKARENGAEILPVENFENLPGLGIKAFINGKKILLGNLKLMENENVGIKNVNPSFFENAAGDTSVFVAENTDFLGTITLSDEIRETSRRAIEKIRKMNVKVYLLTGDNEAVANKIADKLGIDKVIANVMPQDKSGVIESLQKQGNIVMMVGDGINDAPALMQADIGIAIGTGTDIAVDSADIVLMRSDLEDVCKTISISKSTLRCIKQNLFWAFLYNVIGIPIAAGALYSFGILLNPMIAAAAMSLSSICVVSNALRLNRAKI